MSAPRLLVIDIETSPNLGYFWKIWDENIGIDQLVDVTQMICFAAKWYGEPVNRMQFYSEFHHGREAMIEAAHKLLDEADAVIHYNGKKFDIPHLNREFIAAGLNPPSPFKQIDLLQAVKQRFRFPSNKLDYVARALNLGAKMKHDGFVLWKLCMAGDERAWAKMRRYNKQDVLITERLYEAVRAWIGNHPSFGALTGEDVCPKCGSDDLRRKGYAQTRMGKFQQYQCRNCGGWSRSTKRESGTTIAEVVL